MSEIMARQSQKKTKKMHIAKDIDSDALRAGYFVYSFEAFVDFPEHYHFTNDE